MSEFTENDRKEVERISYAQGIAYGDGELIRRLLAERDRLVEELAYAKQRRDEVEDALIVQVEQCGESDIVVRIRMNVQSDPRVAYELLDEAADEIERLRAAITEVRQQRDEALRNYYAIRGGAP